MVTLAKAGESQLVREVGWAPGGKIRRKGITLEAYLRDIAYAEDLRLDVHHQSVMDREGRFMVIAWVATTSGRLLGAYEIQDHA
jgi:hypothetical protein